MGNDVVNHFSDLVHIAGCAVHAPRVLLAVRDADLRPLPGVTPRVGAPPPLVFHRGDLGPLRLFDGGTFRAGSTNDLLAKGADF